MFEIGPGFPQGDGGVAYAVSPYDRTGVPLSASE
jgi:hypothetical protein